jgi:hypothetical protein
MKINARLKKIEDEIQSHSRIPNADRFIAVFPNDTEEEKELKIEKHLEKLRQKYGGDVSRQDIGIMRIVYDKPAEASI